MQAVSTKFQSPLCKFLQDGKASVQNRPSFKYCKFPESRMKTVCFQLSLLKSQLLAQPYTILSWDPGRTITESRPFVQFVDVCYTLPAADQNHLFSRTGGESWQAERAGLNFRAVLLKSSATSHLTQLVGILLQDGYRS